MANYYYVEYDARITAVFAEGEILTFGGTGSGQAEIVDIIPAELTTGEGYLYVADLGALSLADNATITSDGTGTAVVNSTGTGGNIAHYQTKYPAFMRKDISIATSTTGDIRWAGGAPVLFVTHSCQYDGQTTNFGINDILTFSGGGTAELIAQTDGGATGEIQFRLITLPVPLDNETITSDGTGDGAVNGVVHDRTYTPLHLHRFASDLGDDATATGDDLYDITDDDSSERSTDGIISLKGNYNIDQVAIEHFYGGSIEEADGTKWSGIAISLTVNDPLTQPIVIQDDGSGSDALVTNRWKNAYNPDALKGQIRFMIKTNNAGVEINGSRVRVRISEYGDTFFLADTTLGSDEIGVSLFSSNDLNNNTTATTIDALLDPVIVEGFQNIDHLDGSGVTPYSMSYDINAAVSRAEFYEQTKHISRRGTVDTISGRNAQLYVGVDLNFAFDGGDGTGGFLEDEVLTFGNGAKAILIALDTSDNISGNMYCQLMTGVTPSDNDTISGATSTENASVNLAPTTRTINTHYFGQFTGTGFIPNFGITFVQPDGTQNETFTNLLSNTITPPNNVTFTVTGLVIGEDYVLATKDAGGGAIDFTQYTINGIHTASSTVTINGAIDTDTPTSGTIRVLRADGKYDRLVYDSFTGSVFTLNASNSCTAANAANCFNSYIDKLADATSDSFSYIYSISNGARPITVRARDGKASPIKTAPATGTMTSNGGSTSINRITDA